MYLTDFRENNLQEVIIQIEPALFQTVTGLSVADFRMLVDLKVFNTERMNEAVFAFRRYENASLSYTGIDSHPEQHRSAVGIRSWQESDQVRQQQRKCLGKSAPLRPASNLSRPLRPGSSVPAKQYRSPRRDGHLTVLRLGYQVSPITTTFAVGAVAITMGRS